MSYTGILVLLSGDVPLLTPQTLQQLVDRHRTANASATVVTAVVDEPKGYGRIVRDGGHIVFIGSVMSYFGGPKQPAYSASKGAIRNLTMSLAAAYAVDGIRVNAVAPGWVMTQLSKGAREDPTRNAGIMSRTPIGRWADPAEIADPILFLCSDAARYMTGTMMLVDGGYASVG